MSTGRRPGGHDRDRRLIVSALAGLAAGALLVRRSTALLAAGVAAGWLLGRRRGEARDEGETGERR